MTSVVEAEALLLSRYEELKTNCLQGSREALMTMAVSSTRCAKLLTEQLVQASSNGKTAVEEASKTAKSWPISFPALDDGRTNRILEQLPVGLKKSLKINRSYLNATGRHISEHQDENTFLMHALKHEAPFFCDGTNQSKSADVMVPLIILHRKCRKGDINAASIVAEFGVRASELLEELQASTVGSEIRHSLQAVAEELPEWPIHLRHKEDLTELKRRVPKDLGKGLGFRITKRQGTRSDRDFTSDARGGFAFGYFKDLETARKLAREYVDPHEAHYLGLIAQGDAAAEILFNSDYLKLMPEVLQSILADLPADLLKYVQKPMAEIPLEHRDLAVITKKLSNVVPAGTHQMWIQLRDLPDLSQESLQLWIDTAIRLAEIRCQGNWASGEWPPKIAEAAENRLIQTGVTDENYLYKEAVKLWLKQGFHSFVNDSD